MRRLVGIERKLADLKPSYWKTAAADSIKIAITAGAMLWATYLTGKQNQENVLLGAEESAVSTERMKDFREIRRQWVEAKGVFQNYFINAENSGQLLVPQEFKKADLDLLRQNETALVPSTLREKLEEFRKDAGAGKVKCEETNNLEERKSRAKAARLSIEAKTVEINAAFDQVVQRRARQN